MPSANSATRWDALAQALQPLLCDAHVNLGSLTGPEAELVRQALSVLARACQNHDVVALRLLAAVDVIPGTFS